MCKFIVPASCMNLSISKQLLEFGSLDVVSLGGNLARKGFRLIKQGTLPSGGKVKYIRQLGQFSSRQSKKTRSNLKTGKSVPPLCYIVFDSRPVLWVIITFLIKIKVLVIVFVFTVLVAYSTTIDTDYRSKYYFKFSFTTLARKKHIYFCSLRFY